MWVRDLEVDDAGVTRELVGGKTPCVVMPNWVAKETLMSGTCGRQHIRDKGSWLCPHMRR